MLFEILYLSDLKLNPESQKNKPSWRGVLQKLGNEQITLLGIYLKVAIKQV